MIGNTLSSLYPFGSSYPLMIRSASSYLISKIPSLTAPAVVVITDNGCSRADMPSTMTSYRSLFSMACNSSINAQCTFNPSSVLLSLDSGLKEPSLNSLTSSATRVLIRFLRDGDFFTIRFDSDQIILAWSFFVAADTISGPGSPSATNMYNATADPSVDLPFFLATMRINSRYLRVPSIL